MRTQPEPLNFKLARVTPKWAFKQSSRCAAGAFTVRADLGGLALEHQSTDRNHPRPTVSNRRCGDLGVADRCDTGQSGQSRRVSGRARDLRPQRGLPEIVPHFGSNHQPWISGHALPPHWHSPRASRRIFTAVPDRVVSTDLRTGVDATRSARGLNNAFIGLQPNRDS